jgi:uncharacterized protein YdaU (DUF1376 family)
MAALPYMRLYIADYLADTAHLSAAQHGAYLLLIMNYWQTGRALPADDVKLARIARMTPKEWAEHGSVLAEFFQDVDGAWRHKRIEQELDEVRAKSDKARTARSQRTRYGRSTNVEHSLSKKPTDDQRTSNHTDTDTDSVADATGAAAPPDDRTWLFNQGLRSLAEHSGKPGASLRSVIGRWLKLTGDDAAMVRAEIEAATGPPNPVADPVAWIEARLKPKAPHGQSEQFRRRTAQFAGLAAAAESLAAGENVGPGLVALPQPGSAGRGVEVAQSGLSQGPVRLSAAGGRTGH